VRPLLVTVAILAVAAAALGGRSASRAADADARGLRPAGIDAVRFGTTKAQAVAELRARFGAPDARGVNTGCGARYTEVEWGDLVAEFRLNRFSGYRYVKGGYPLTTRGSPRESSPPTTASPPLATATGTSLGSTLGQVRVDYPLLHPVGTDRWRAANGLVFVDEARHSPEPSTSRIVEIEIGTCGDF
jgi:hypothetical protein